MVRIGIGGGELDAVVARIRLAVIDAAIEDGDGDVVGKGRTRQTRAQMLAPEA